METKIIIPFDVELAKKITNGEVDGKVVTRDGQSVRIVACLKGRTKTCGGFLWEYAN